MPSDSRKARTLDVRPILAAGGEPFAKIMAMVESTGPGETFTVISPFIPAPLIERLGGDGFSARPEPQPDGSWYTLFRREA